MIVSRGLGERIRNLGFTDVRELSWWESTKIKKVEITATPAKHILSKCSGYIIEGSQRVYFAGDTGLSDGFKEIGQRFKIDVAILPIGDYYPRLWFVPGFKKMTRNRHMSPDDIPAAIEMLRAKTVMPIHWGTFKISGTGLNEPIKILKKIIKEKKLERKIFILNHGETKVL